MGSAASAVDRAAVAAMSARGARDRARAERMSHAERMQALTLIAETYRPGHADFFPPPLAIDPKLREVRRGVWDAAWPSTSEPWLSLVAEKYLSRVPNRTALARLFFGPARGRPAVIIVHGYMGGWFVFDEPQWPIAWFLRRGLDVALPVLPFHGPRGGAPAGAPSFPSADPRMTNEGFRQAVADITALAAHLRDRGAPRVGIIGVSLGGYTSALVATVSDAIDFVMPVTPLASIADFGREQGRLGVGALGDEQHAALERANWIVSPLSRPATVPSSRAIVVAAENDRITPSAHARRLSSHFGCELLTIPGGHLVQIGRADAFRGLAAMLEREGIIESRSRPRR